MDVDAVTHAGSPIPAPALAARHCRQVCFGAGLGEGRGKGQVQVFGDTALFESPSMRVQERTIS